MIAESALVRAVSTFYLFVFFFFFFGIDEPVRSGKTTDLNVERGVNGERNMITTKRAFLFACQLLFFGNVYRFQRRQNVRLFPRGRRRARGTFLKKNYAFLLSSKHSKNVRNISRKRFK